MDTPSQMADKRRARQGSIGGNYTPAQAKKLLALPLYALLSKQAVPIFPGTSLAAPSGLVGIFRLPGTACRQAAIQATPLPVWINGTQWERAVVPVLIDPRWASTNPLFQSLQTYNLISLIDMVGNALAQSFHDAGYGPLPAG
jgi:hypothetical protein